MTMLYLISKVEMLSSLLEVERCAMYLYDKSTDELYCKVITGRIKEAISFPREQAGIIGEVFNTGNPIYVKAPYEDHRFNPTIDHKLKTITKNMLVVPIKFSNHAIGCIEIANK